MQLDIQIFSCVHVLKPISWSLPALHNKVETSCESCIVEYQGTWVKPMDLILFIKIVT
jgi:hypothetical protein